MPTYKTRFLREAVESILNQTYKDFLLIISDDCSPEPVYHVIEPYLKDERVQYRRNSRNYGAERLVDHWNLLVSICSSEYLILPGDDDIYEAHFLEKIDQLSQQYPEIDCIRSRSQRIDMNGTCFQTEISIPQIQTQQRFLSGFYNSGIIHCLGNNVFKRSSLIEVGGFPHFPLAWFCDDAAVIQLSNNSIATMSGIHFSFRRSEISISGNENNQIINQKIKATRLFYQWVKDHPIVGKDLSFCKIVKDRCYNDIVWNDITTLGVYDIIQVMWSLKSVRIGASWLKRIYYKQRGIEYIWGDGNSSLKK